MRKLKRRNFKIPILGFKAEIEVCVDAPHPALSRRRTILALTPPVILSHGAAILTFVDHINGFYLTLAFKKYFYIYFLCKPIACMDRVVHGFTEKEADIL